MFVKIAFAELHTPLFLAGKNFGQKLIPNTMIFLSFNTEDKALYVEYQGKVARLPEAAVASLTPVDPTDLGYQLQNAAVTPPRVVSNVSHPRKTNVSKSAQVSDPTGVLIPRVK